MKTTLIYPVYNRGELLERSLKRVFELPTKPDEIIVVNDGSSDNTKEIAERFGCKHIYIDNQRYDACSRPKNVGLKVASHEVVIFSEPEVMFVTDFIGQIKEKLSEDIIISAGTMYFEKRHYKLNHSLSLDDAMKEARITEWETGTIDVHADTGSLTVAKEMVALFTLATYKKNLFDIGGWDEDMMLDNGGGGYGFDDTDLVTRLRVNGVNQKVDQEIEALHQWHERVPFPQANGWMKNEKIFNEKKEGDELTKENIVANKGRDWGVA